MNLKFGRVFRTSSKQILLGTLLLSFAVTSFAYAASYKAHEVKAAYLYQIANFVKWADEDKKTILFFCIRDDQELSHTFAKITKGKKIRGLEIVTNQPDSNCDVLYVGNALANIQQTNQSLTISSNKGFSKRGGTIELKQIKNKIQPIVNLKMSKSDYFTISSKFMRISKIERGS